jgi:hypothetical protein
MAESKFLAAIAAAVAQAVKDGMDQASIAAALTRCAESVDNADGG